MAKRKIKKKTRAWYHRLFIAVAISIVAALLLTVGQVLLLRTVNPPFTARTAWARALQAAGVPDARPPAYVWRPLERINPQLQQAVFAGEDQRFLQHRGFDVIELKNAVEEMAAGERLRGASTISMQTARTVFLPQSRTLLRKAAESYYTVLIEAVWSKRRILEMYLNTVDWGEGIMGAEAAAWMYFKKPADRLDRDEAARLAAILPNPRKWSPVLLSGQAAERYRRILQEMSQMPTLR
ncbi:MAG: monofunctional biosynthetic peptidoglycan transglycosylase [Pseudomonadota bacterium]